MKAGGDHTGRWSDLGRRIVSAVVLLIVGIVLALSSGVWLAAGMSIIIGITFWELARLTGWRHPELHDTPFGAWRPIALAVLAGLSLFVALMWFDDVALLMLLVPILAGLPGAARDERWPFAVFGLAILLVGFGLVGFREALGLPFILWLVGIVILSDISGYFAGKAFGGPKFWPKLSPKKTWSGTVAGWIAGALAGLIIWATGHGSASLIWISPIVVFAGQLGDIAESWLKRRAGVKDSSDLIPGHGGFMDRFDAICGATLALMAINLVAPLPAVF